jgi:membrane dipeptidase
MPKGLEDVSKFPRLVEVLMERGATDEQVRMFAGENLLRVWTEVEKVAKQLREGGVKPLEAEYEGRIWHADPENDMENSRPCYMLS